MVRVPFDQAVETLATALRALGFSEKRAELCARMFVESSRDGVYSHGLHRFPRFVRTIRNGNVRPEAEPELVEQRGGLERWNGRFGPGNLNAHQSMQRAIELAREQGVGCVALAHTNHWMRGGTYGWQAAEAGAIAICWTNTLPNLSPWGSQTRAIGNNPLVIAAPRKAGHVVLDMAMSQFSYGALESHRLRGEPLPVAGGYGRDGELTRDAAEIEATQRLLPAGYWKGSGLSIVLDIISGMLSGGTFTHQIAPDPNHESGLSQVFVAFDVRGREKMADAVIDNLREVTRGEPVRYPGEKALSARRENMERGIPVDEAIWSEIRQV